MSTPAFDGNSTIGAMLLGTMVGAVLFGVTTMQAYMYWTRFPDDHWAIKATVCFIWLAEATHVGLVTNTVYELLIVDYGHPERLLERPPRSIIGYIFMTVTIAVSVQVFFSYRIYVLSQSRIIPFITYTLSFVRLAFGTSLFSVGLSVTSVTQLITKWQWIGLVMWSLSAAEDVLITGTLVYLLMQQKGRVHKTTNAFLDKIIMWSIETGLLTSSFSLITVILFHTMPNNFIWIAFSTIEARMFSNSLLASLNSRSVLREIRDRPKLFSGGLLSFSSLNWGKQTATVTEATPAVAVKMHTRTMETRDSDFFVQKASALDG
ncbi:hypothetical protein C8F01DRAFT_1365869 [Mycena amicta]|nr:hypothetical protein C8F01DRAFT_1365869 [Mycena amicta]